MSELTSEMYRALQDMQDVTNGNASNNFYLSVFHAGWLQKTSEHADISLSTLAALERRGLIERRKKTWLFRLTETGAVTGGAR